LYAKAKLVNEGKYWKHKATYESTQKSENEIVSAKRWFATEKSDYKITAASYLFLAFTYESDHFSGFDYQATEAFGYGYHIIKQDDLKLDAEAGVGARQTRTDLGAYNSEGIAKGAINFEWKVSKTATFSQDLSAEAGKGSTISRSETALKMAIVGNLSAKLSHRIKHSSDVPEGKKKTNTESVVTLVYSF
jgi:putative salt-induced outer membrane protein